MRNQTLVSDCLLTNQNLLIIGDRNLLKLALVTLRIYWFYITGSLGTSGLDKWHCHHHRHFPLYLLHSLHSFLHALSLTPTIFWTFASLLLRQMSFHEEWLGAALWLWVASGLHHPSYPTPHKEGNLSLLLPIYEIPRKKTGWLSLGHMPILGLNVMAGLVGMEGWAEIFDCPGLDQLSIHVARGLELWLASPPGSFPKEGMVN